MAHPRYNSTLQRTRLKFAIIILFLARTSYSVGLYDDDQFANWRAQSKKENPTRAPKAATAVSDDLYQPYYVCGSDDDSESLNMNEWHYSCKQSCSDTNNRHQVNITRMKWEYVGTSVDVYKINTYKTCWTSHENIWGSCSHTQTTSPVETTSADTDILRSIYLKLGNMPKEGSQHITNSQQAECDYFADQEHCARDYVITHKLGKISKKSDDDPEVLNIYSDGIRVNPFDGVIHLNDVSYIWDESIALDYTECGWKDVGDTTCTFIETSDTLKCDDIGYTYNIHDTYNKTTCNGEVFDIHGPSPFRYLTRSEMTDRETIVKKAVAGKPDPDVSFITGVNYALSELESTYCSSMCDLFSKVSRSNIDHVLDTPIGAWRLQTKDPLRPKMLPCMPTAKWVIKYPFQMCKLPNSILVEDQETKHVNLWDAKRDYIVLGQLCGGPQDSECGNRLGDLKMRMTRQEDFKIEFWNGDVAMVGPPYGKAVWQKGNQSFRSNPSWFTKVKLDPSMLHTREDISGMLTEYVSNVTDEMRYKKEEGTTIYNFLTDEILEGIEGVGSTIWTGITGIMGGITKIAVMLIILIVLYLVIKILILMRGLLKTTSRNRRGSSRHHVRWSPETHIKNIEYETTPLSDPPPYDSQIVQKPSPTMARRNIKKNLHKILEI